MSGIPQKTDYRALLQNALVTLEKMKTKVDAAEQAQHEPLAIVGMGCRFPGGANNLASFWQVLVNGIDVITDVPPERWDIEAYYDPDPDAPGKTYTRWGGFLKDVDRFDPEFFGIAPREAVTMDPQQRLLLEVTWEALEDAGHAGSNLADSLTGVFVGMTGSDYANLKLKTGDMSDIDAYFGTGVSRSVAAGRIAYLLGLMGPALAVDTACSSSSVAVHLACQSLRSRECNMAVAGGVNLMLSPDGSISTSRARMMSFDGRCKTFDVAADGYVRADGCAMIVLKRLSDAVADGDHIHALILGTALNQDGRSNGLTAPNGKAQETVIKAALQDAGIAPAEVSFVETHGTGTTLGDPIEVRALGTVFSDSHSDEYPLMISSVKTNVGHLEAAAGIAGLFKTVLALKHRTIPPHLHLREPNPYIPWDELPVTVPTEPTSWQMPDGKRLVAGLSSFGFSGTNSHMILAEAPVVERKEAAAERPYHLLTLSAKNETALRELAERFVAYFTAADASLADACYTANTGRTHAPERLALTAVSTSDMQQKLTAWLAGSDPAGCHRGSIGRSDAPEVVFLFTGQGAQYAGMGRQLYETQPVFRRVLDKCDQLLRPYLERPLLEVIFADDQENPLLHQTMYTQPALFAIEYALAQVWMSWGMQPAAVMGHSVGEFVAACLARVFSLEDGLKLIAARGKLMQSLPGGGTMAAVFADEAQVSPVLAAYADKVSIAAVNGPNNIVISGEGTAVSAILDQLKADGIKSRDLTVSHAFHSPLMEPILQSFAQVAASVTYHAPQIDLVSNVTGRFAAPDEVTNADYWRDHVRAAVRFADSVQALRSAGYHVLIECGPQPTLLGMAQRIPLPDGAAADVSVPSLRSGQNDWAVMLDSLGLLTTQGVAVDWLGVDREFGRFRAPLPTYPFQRQRFWMDLPKDGQQKRRGRGEHPLLGERLRSPLISGSLFESELSTDAPAFLNDHRIFETPLFPATAYLEMALAAANNTFGAGHYVVESVLIQEALVLPEHAARQVQVVLEKMTDGTAGFQLFSLRDADSDEWVLHVSGKIRLVETAVSAAPVDINEIKARCVEPMSAADYYRQLANIGVGYGPGFCGLVEIWRRDGEALGRAALTDVLAPDAGQYQMHPALLDACIQLFGAAIPGAGDGSADGNVYIPVNLGTYRLVRTGAASLWCQAAIAGDDGVSDEALRGELTLFDNDGQIVATLTDVQLRRASRESVRRATQKQYDDWFYVVDWEALETGDVSLDAAPGSWLILADENGLGERVAVRLQEQGHRCVLSLAKDVDLLPPEAMVDLVTQVTHDAERPYRGAIHLWALDAKDGEPTESDLALTYGSALHLAAALAQQKINDAHLWLVTRGGQSVHGEAVSPTQTVLWGLANTLNQEHAELQTICLDLDAASGDDETAVLTQLGAVEAEDQIAWRDGNRFAARLARYREQSDAFTLPAGAYELTIQERGVLDNLTLQPVVRQQPGPGEIEIEVGASGLNFRDVLNVLGMYPGPAGPIGNECAGVVTAVGADVTQFAVGDRVMALATSTFSRYVSAPAVSAYCLPDAMSLDEAATIPLVFLTAYYGLHHLAQMQAGDKVLIHAAAGGVGMAAVQLALQAGAEVYATASPPKWAALRQMGVRHIFNSRTLDFADEVLGATNGRGVDIVLNSLTGEFIPKSLGVLAENGRFLEIGKRDLWTAEQVSALNPTLQYHIYDLGLALQQDGSLMGEMLDEMMPGFAAEQLKPLPRHLFSITRAREAFRFMAQARHIGKIVVTHGSQDDTARPASDASYLITGGLGGLGLTVARGLVERGAKHLVLMSRSRPSDAAQAVLAELAEAGAEIAVLPGDVSQRADVERVLAQIAAQMPPLRGVIHAAGVLDDGVLAQQNWSRFQTVKAPKIDGAWHLHELTAPMPLDFFILFSAGASLLGSPGQANYAAANAYLDGLAHMRRAANLPALSINWGAWAQVGMAAALGKREQQRWAAAGTRPILPEDGVAALWQLMSPRLTQVGVLPVDWRQVAQQVSDGGERPLLRHLIQAERTRLQPETTTQGVDILAELETAVPSDRIELLKHYIQTQVVKVLGLEPSRVPDDRQGLSDIGMDSLMAVELSNRLQSGIKQPLPTTLAFEYPTIAVLTHYLATEVLALETADSVPETGEVDSDSDTVLTELETLSDSETEDSLLKELEDAGY
jgi:acyl transferase domain-containing protein/Zn-dependent alcohol dehydrogenase/acyl carrier protein